MSRMGRLLAGLLCVCVLAGGAIAGSRIGEHSNLKLSAPAASAPTPFGQDSSRYALAFAEEFDGNALDPSRWNDRIWYLPRSGSPDCRVAHGKLKIWPHRDAAGRWLERIINTDGKFYQTYGYFEMEAKLPYGRGLWPAFWLINRDDQSMPNPLRPEIDIMEAYPGEGRGYWSKIDLKPIAYSVTIWPVGAQGQKGSKDAAGRGVVKTPDLSAGFHKYGMQWEPKKISFFFDGKPVYSLNVEISHRMFLLVNLQYGSESGNPDSTTPAHPGNAFEINYIRTWLIRDVPVRTERPDAPAQDRALAC